MPLFGTILAFGSLFLPYTALAQNADIEEGLAAVAGGSLNEDIGGGEIGGIFQEIMESLLPFMNAAAVLLIVAFGLVMVVSQDENQFTNARRVVFTVCIGIILLNLVPAIFDAYVTWDSGGASILITEVRGLIRFFETPIAALAVLTIIISGIRAIVAFGSDNGIQQLRNTIIAICTGILLLVFKYVIVGDVADRLRPTGITASIVSVVRVITVFVGVLAVLGIIYAGMLMILNVGNDEQYSKARGLLARIAIGIIIILAAEAIISAVLQLDIFFLF